MTAAWAEFEQFEQNIRTESKRLGIGEGQAKGKAEAVLRVLAARQLEVSTADRERIMSERDQSVLDRWLDRALTARAVSEIF